VASACPSGRRFPIRRAGRSRTITGTSVWGGRALAAKREPTLRIGASVFKPKLDRAEPNPILKLQITGQPTGDKLTVDARIRRPADEPIQLSHRSHIGRSNSRSGIPKLPAGEYHADVQVSSSAGVETWTTVPFRVTAARSVSGIKSLRTGVRLGAHRGAPRSWPARPRRAKSFAFGCWITAGVSWPAATSSRPATGPRSTSPRSNGCRCW